MSRRLSALPIVFVGACLVGVVAACSSGSTSTPAEPAATAPAATPVGTPVAEPGTPTPAGEPAAATARELGEPSEPPKPGPSRYVPPVRGTADVAYVTPKTVVKNNVVITTITVRNTSNGSIAGLKIEEYWWDKSSNPVTGDSVRLTKPLLPGETATLTLETPKDPRMFRNTYVFRHAFGAVKATLQKSLE
ncbi:MAG: hypothetical protein AB1806_12875 [Acidobacteriota bacterium]